MRFKLTILPVILVFITLACAENFTMNSFKQSSGTIDRSSDSSEYVARAEISNEMQAILDEVSQMSTSTMLSYVRASNKPIKFCMFYGYAEAPNNGHGCDGGLFDVTINGVKQEKILNINNATQRIVRGIHTGHEYLVPSRAFTAGHLDESLYQSQREDAPDYTPIDVPGTEYEGTLDEEGNFRVNTECNSYVYEYPGYCHKGIVSFTLLGNVDVVYKGFVITKTLVVRKDRLTTGKEEVRNFKDLEVSELDDNIYTFDDWCNPLVVEKSAPRIYKEEELKDDLILKDLTDEETTSGE